MDCEIQTATMGIATAMALMLREGTQGAAANDLRRYLSEGQNPLLGESPFAQWMAAERYDLGRWLMEAAWALEAERGVQVRGADGQTLLHVLAAYSPAQAIQWVKRADPACDWTRIQDREGHTPLLTAATRLWGSWKARPRDPAYRRNHGSLSSLVDLMALMLTRRDPIGERTTDGFSAVMLMRKAMAAGAAMVATHPGMTQTWQRIQAVEEREQLDHNTAPALGGAPSRGRL